MGKILISNIGFGDSYNDALSKLSQFGDLIINTEKIRFDENYFLQNIDDVEVIVAGTEKISRKVIEKASNLKLIARVGVGVDNIDLDAAKENRISICYTPEAPSLSVPEFTLALMLNLVKGIGLNDRYMHQHNWYRPMGRMLSSMTIGIVGIGKIGKAVINLIHAIAPAARILFYDTCVQEHEFAKKIELTELFKMSDIISIHLPLNVETTNLVNQSLLQQMRSGSFLINTSRGEIVDESALYVLLESNYLGGAALDVFEEEPYKGPLCDLENCLLTSHIGSMTKEVRGLMEEQVIEDVTQFLLERPLLRPFMIKGKAV